MKLSLFVQGYVECALWSSNDESTPEGGEPMDKNYSLEDFTPEALAQMTKDCEQFQEENKENLDIYYTNHPSRNWTPQEAAGHDLWLTRNGHGVGFWDRGWLPEGVGESLSEAARAMGECNLIVGDDKKIHVS